MKVLLIVVFNFFYVLSENIYPKDNWDPLKTVKRYYPDGAIRSKRAPLPKHIQLLVETRELKQRRTYTDVAFVSVMISLIWFFVIWTIYCPCLHKYSQKHFPEDCDCVIVPSKKLSSK